VARLVAFYDGLRSPCTYDFVCFASLAKTAAHGSPVHFVFVPREDGTRSKPGKFDPDEAEYRFRHIVLEAAPFFGTFTICQTREEAKAYEGGDTFPVGYSVENPVFNYQMNGVIDLIDQGHKMAGPKPTAKAVAYVANYLAGIDPIVVTIRNSRHPVRNSTGEAWDEFAEKNDVVFVPDTDDAFGLYPHHRLFTQAAVNMDIRLALYSQAKLNCFTSNGCGVLCWFTDYPYLWFKAGGDGYMDKAEWDKLKVPYGTQPKFIGPNQRWVWEPDNLDVIEREVANILRV